ncbi:M48 family metallopeptidase [Nocardioides cavernaquae]|uniref:M48 family peptidase n=1 Tax=Nocardioides cavernaquae TaxID=2321396 RepID=A0A3A5H1Z0_9ACTN|nr:M48 family metallopeptidase [Nocardioides cavernaquae]RJS44846.1 M48 family peptidase [Nocardioides cavernaquae]
MRERTVSSQVLGVVLALLGLVGFAVLVALRVPWHPVAGGTPGPVAVDSVFTAAEVRRASAYADGARLIGWTSLGVSLLVACWLGFTPRGARLLGRLPLPWLLRVIALVLAVLAIGRLVGLPFVLLAWRHRGSVGLTDQPVGGLLRDQAVGLGLAVVFTAVAVVVLIGLARRLPRAWPIAAAVLGCGLVVAATYMYPRIVEPAFNHFTPLPDGSLHDRIGALAQKEGVPLDEVLVADASRRTTAANAYVSGVGDSRRIVVYDTLLAEMSEPEVLSVVAHELAHARHDDVMTGALLGAAGTVMGVGLLASLLGSGRLRERAGVSGAGDPQVVALVLALMAIGSLAAAPVENAVSRQLETRADVDALKATGDPVAFEAMQRKLALGAVSDPEPPAWSQWWFGSHPTVLQRIAVARAIQNGSSN